MKHGVLAACLLLWIRGLLAATPAPPPSDVRIVSAEFGVFDASNPKQFVFEPTRIVPRKEGQRYGWIIEVRTRKRSLAVREEYLLPTAATEAVERIDLSGNQLDIPLPRRSQVSQRQLVPMRGQIYGEWAVGPGEPAGKRILQVIVEGQLAGSFEYEVR